MSQRSINNSFGELDSEEQKVKVLENQVGGDQKSE